MWQELLQNVLAGNFKSLARSISLVENEAKGYEIFLQSLPVTKVPVIGITGPPGAGKSTLTDALIESYVLQHKKVGVVCVDPSSPFNLGAILGDRIRMSNWYVHPLVYIRSLASRGAMGGLNTKIFEVTDVMKAAGFDVIIVETVGVGQAEIEIAGLADITVVVLVPESGDEIQIMKAGLMEIADIFVVNKSDRPGANKLLKSIELMLHSKAGYEDHSTAVVKTTATSKEGIDELRKAIAESASGKNKERKNWMLAERIFRLIQLKRMNDVDRFHLSAKVKEKEEGFNVYGFSREYEDWLMQKEKEDI